MTYKKTVRARFISRPNRFIAIAELDGSEVVCHVKNTGRCRELLVPGAEIVLSDERDNIKRKTPFDLIAVKKGDILINMDSQAPNKAAAELLSRLYPGARLHAEHTVGHSRLDFCLKCGDDRRFVEVKGVTLENDGVAMFPDAPTVRGIKHLDTLISLAEAGYKATALFIIQMKGPHVFMPNRETHSAFAEKLGEAARKGVEIRAFDCIVTDSSMVADKPVEVDLLQTIKC